MDHKDITYHGWYIVGWDVATGLAIASCDQCPPPFWIESEKKRRGI